jgi:hypothetical protein
MTLARWQYLSQQQQLCTANPSHHLTALDMLACVVRACAVTAEAAALAVESLIKSGSIGGSSGVTGYVDAAGGSPAAAQQPGALVALRTLAEQQQQQQGQSGQLLTPHEALMW